MHLPTRPTNREPATSPDGLPGAAPGPLPGREAASSPPASGQLESGAHLWLRGLGGGQLEPKARHGPAGASSGLPDLVSVESRPHSNGDPRPNRGRPPCPCRATGCPLAPQPPATSPTWVWAVNSRTSWRSSLGPSVPRLGDTLAVQRCAWRPSSWQTHRRGCWHALGLLCRPRVQTALSTAACPAGVGGLMGGITHRSFCVPFPTL